MDREQKEKWWDMWD